MTPKRRSTNGGSMPAIELCLCEGDALIRQLESKDWRRLRDARLRALASDPGAFLVTLDEARKFPDERWRERGRAAAAAHGSCCRSRATTVTRHASMRSVG